MRGKGVLIGLLVICSLLPVVSTRTPISPDLCKSESPFCFAETDVFQMLQDVDLIDEPNFHICGESDEFSYLHSDFFDNDFGVSMMTWNHTANNTVTTDDGVCLKKSFDWLYTSEYPRSGFATVEYAFDLGGDFDYSSTMRGYVHFRVWLETPSGETRYIGGSSLPTGYSFDNETFYFGFNVGHAWDEVVNDASPNPDNTFSVCVGFYPDIDFFYANTGLEPWQLYSGSVTLLVKSLEVELTRGTSEDSDEVASPIWENHWETSPANKEDFPRNYPPILDRRIEDNCRGLEILDDGSIVSLVYSYYDDGTVRFNDMVIQRWGATTNFLWYKRILNFIPRAMTSDGENIYVAGTRNGVPFLSKWTEAGRLVWNSTWDLGLGVTGLCITTDSEGSTYLYLERYNGSAAIIVDSYMIKVDMDGGEVWQKCLNQTRITEMYAGNGTSIFTNERWPGIVKEWDFNGNILSTITRMDYFLVDSDSLITIEYQDSNLNILTLNRTGYDGTTIWSTDLSIVYPPDYHEKLILYDVEIASDGSILLLIHLDRFAKEYRLYRFFENGTLDCFKIVGWMPLMSVWKSYYMVPSTNGLVYFYAREYQTIHSNPDHPEYVEYDDLFFKVEAYNYTNYVTPLIPLVLVPYISAGVGIVTLVVVIFIIRRWRISISSNQ